MKKPSKKTIIATSSVVALACLAGATFAYFKAEDTGEDQQSKIGTVTIKDVDINIGTPENKEGTVNTDAIVDENGNLLKLNPGDLIPVDFTITNTGSKSIEEKTYVYIIFNNKGSADYGTYSNFMDCVSILDENDKEITTTKGIYTDEDGKTYKALRFDVGSSVLNGNPDKTNAETQPDVATSHEKKHTFKINFALGANIHTMDQSLEVKTFTQAIQYRNTSTDELESMMDDSKIFTKQEW